MPQFMITILVECYALWRVEGARPVTVARSAGPRGAKMHRLIHTYIYIYGNPAPAVRPGRVAPLANKTLHTHAYIYIHIIYMHSPFFFPPPSPLLLPCFSFTWIHTSLSIVAGLCQFTLQEEKLLTITATLR